MRSNHGPRVRCLTRNQRCKTIPLSLGISSYWRWAVMSETTVSSKYQVVIPKDDRERAGLQVGQKLMVTVKHGVIKLVPLKTLDELEGFVKGIDTEGYREEEDRY